MTDLEALALPINPAVRLSNNSYKNPGRLVIRTHDHRAGWVVWFGIRGPAPERQGKAWPAGVIKIHPDGSSALVLDGAKWRKIPWHGIGLEPSGGPNVTLAELSMGRATYEEIRAENDYFVWAVAPDGRSRSRAYLVENDIYDTRFDSGYGTPLKRRRSVIVNDRAAVDFPPGFDHSEPPPPEPPPDEDEPPMPENLLDDVRAERAKYPTPMLNEQMGELVNAVAWNHRADGWGLAGKSVGARTKQPHTGIEISRDLMIHKPSRRMFDVLRDVEGEAEPSWNDVGAMDMPFVVPVDPDGGEPDPDPDPDPEPSGEYERGLRDAIAAIERLL